MKKFLLYVLLCYSINSFSQNIDFNLPCMKYNAYILTNSIFKLFSKDTISAWLDKTNDIVFRCEVDSTGQLNRIIGYNKSNILTLTENDLQRIENYLKNNELKIRICYITDYAMTEEQKQKEIIRSKNSYNESYGKSGLSICVIGTFSYFWSYKKDSTYFFYKKEYGSKYDFIQHTLEEYEKQIK